jgi:transducin (beta)-like 1
MSVTSDEINYLVYRYLAESGFQHSSFCFQYESLVHLQDKNTVNNGQLINLIQKGLLFSQVEHHINPVLIFNVGWNGKEMLGTIHFARIA